MGPTIRHNPFQNASLENNNQVTLPVKEMESVKQPIHDTTYKVFNLGDGARSYMDLRMISANHYAFKDNDPPDDGPSSMDIGCNIDKVVSKKLDTSVQVSHVDPHAAVQ